MDSIVRRMVQADIEAVIQVLDRVVSVHPAYISHSEIQLGIAADESHLHEARQTRWRGVMSAYLSRYPRGMWVAEDEGAVVGLIAAVVEENTVQSFGIVQDFCIVPSYRHRGLGGRLLKKVLEEYERDGVTRIFFESGIRNTELHDMAKRLGFRTVSMVFVGETTTIQKAVRDLGV